MKVLSAASIKGISVSLRFLGAVVHSRCSSDTACVWAGEVKVKIGESTNAGSRVVTLEQVELHLRSTVRIAAKAIAQR